MKLNSNHRYKYSSTHTYMWHVFKSMQRHSATVSNHIIWPKPKTYSETHKRTYMRFCSLSQLCVSHEFSIKTTHTIFHSSVLGRMCFVDIQMRETVERQRADWDGCDGLERGNGHSTKVEEVYWCWEQGRQSMVYKHREWVYIILKCNYFAWYECEATLILFARFIMYV